MRSCMGVSLVAMTDYTGDTNKQNSISSNGSQLDDEFRVEGVLNALMLTPPVSIIASSISINCK